MPASALVGGVVLPVRQASADQVAAEPDQLQRTRETANLMQKLGVTNIIELLKRAAELGLLQ